MRDRRRLAFAAALTLLVTVVVAGVVLARDTGPAAPISSAGGGDGLVLSGTDVLTGEEIALADFAGKPVVVNIWASWCPGCNAEAAALARFAEAHPEAGFLGIDFWDSRGDQAAAARLRFLGSPTIRVDGVNIEPEGGGRGDFALSCRVFQPAHGPSGHPDERWLRGALERAARYPDGA